jgi:predicted 2-oxoglutarate/Fe(II)-dependent dioxygenase YbiX
LYILLFRLFRLLYAQGITTRLEIFAWIRILRENRMDLESEHVSITMPLLAGKPLEPPRFHKTDWKIGDKFQEKDNIDRTESAWRLPSFLTAANKMSPRPSNTGEQKLIQATAEESKKTTGGAVISNFFSKGTPETETTTFASVIRNVLSQEQCAELISCINSKGFTPALLNVGGGFQVYAPNVRDGNRAIVDSPEMGRYLFHVLRPHLPERIGDMQLINLNERLRFLCYKPGQKFKLHTDGMYQRPAKGQHAGENAGDLSMITVQLYLRDIPKEFGGATTFIPPESIGDRVAYQPEAGSALLFTQDLPHEGSRVEQGIKYTVRTEVMCRLGDS